MPLQRVAQFPKMSLAVGRAMSLSRSGIFGMEAFSDRNEALGLPVVDVLGEESVCFMVCRDVLVVVSFPRLSNLPAPAATQQADSSLPFDCTFRALDIIRSDVQKSEASLRGLYVERGLPRPKVLRTNEEWFLRQGYEIIGAEAEPYEWTVPVTGRVMRLPCAFSQERSEEIGAAGVG
ncbi:hypothetical protein E4U43_004415 [Claviceps pusilla]|uniref:Uncharacterized protein n=1 Tax=Claviceps pusilla TaxID=123648 RepID=A0A9P7N667_9HYPO|nr:hypothetical protein E4U43_004415 [Claviceps pusilla]